MGRYNVLSGITKTVRILELCLALFFLSWLLTRLPFALRLSAPYLRTPLFVFAISNAIIAALFAQSRRFSSAPIADHHHHNDLRDTCTDSDFPDLGNVRCLTQSEKAEDVDKTAEREVRRSETEKTGEILYPQDKLSNEEFQRTIEAFIAKQIRFLREEKESSSSFTTNQIPHHTLIAN